MKLLTAYYFRSHMYTIVPRQVRGYGMDGRSRYRCRGYWRP